MTSRQEQISTAIKNNYRLLINIVDATSNGSDKTHYILLLLCTYITPGLAKGGLISKRFSLWHQSPKKMPNQGPS